jgi:hypothetical protein
MTTIRMTVDVVSGELASAVYQDAKRRLDESKVPMMPYPPRSFRYRSRRVVPMAVAEADRWLGIYNAWVERWNTHEKSLDLPLNPKWNDAKLLWRSHVRQLLFEINEAEPRRLAVFKPVRTWDPFEEGWSFCRRSISKDQIVWAAWLQSRRIAR